MSFLKRSISIVVCLTPSWLAPLASPGEVRSGDRLCFALKGARVVAGPGRVIERGTVVIRGGVIGGGGPVERVAVPEDARVFDLEGKVVHAAFIDPHVPVDTLAGRRSRGPQDEEETEESRDTTG